MNDLLRAPRRPAGFWIRAAAAIVDFVLFAVVHWSLEVFGALAGHSAETSALVDLASFVFTVAFAGLYTTMLHALGGQTLGKLLVGVRVVGLQGERPGVGTALLRFLAYFASLLPLGMGFVMAGLRRDKRGLHDLLAGTYVERLAAPAPAAEPAPAEAAQETPPS